MTSRDGTDKERLRERLRTRRRELPDCARIEASRAVCERLGSWSKASGVSSVAGYLSFDNEVDVEPFLERRLDDGRVALPRVVDDESMEYVEVGALDEVEEGAFGIREPVGEPCRIGSLDLFLVPGVGFDRDGERLGMGWGYYDRALARRRDADVEKAALFVGVCYDCQLVDDAIPTESHDVRMDAVVTEQELVCCSSRGAADSTS